MFKKNLFRLASCSVLSLAFFGEHIKNNNICTKIVLNNENKIVVEKENINFSSKFDDCTYEIDENNYFVFKCISKVNESLIDNVSLQVNNSLTKYITRFDFEQSIFYVKIQKISNDIIVDENELEATPVYNETESDYFVCFNDGTNISVRETLEVEQIDYCSFKGIVNNQMVEYGAAAGAIVLGAIAINTIVSSSNSNDSLKEKILKDSLTDIGKGWVEDFVMWLYDVFPSLLTITSSIAAPYVYHALIEGIEYDFTRVENASLYNQDNYYFAIADTTDGMLYLSSPVEKNILSGGVALMKWILHPNQLAYKGKKFLLSGYTYKQENAFEVAKQVAHLIFEEGVTFHSPKTGQIGYYSHYHPGVYDGYCEDKPHIFFGAPLGV